MPIQYPPFEYGVTHSSFSGHPLVASSPLGRGFLTGQIRKFEDLPKDDFRHMNLRFQADAFDNNIRLVEAAEGIAKCKVVTVAQVAISWVRHQGAIPIPGSTTVERVLENYKYLPLSREDLDDWEV